MNQKRIIALVDCNAFYCSCERLFRPELKNRPVGVLSNNDGCFVSRTTELKALGVPMGAPYFKYKKICDDHQVAIFSANFSLYSQLSDRVMQSLFQYTPHLEIYSIDEAFLDLSGMQDAEAYDYCIKIKNDIYQNTGIPVGIGLAQTKVLAKVANKVAKTYQHYAGVCSLLDEKNIDQALKVFPIGELWGIGRQNTRKMQSINIKTAYDLKHYKNRLMIQKQFTKLGLMIMDELNQINCFPFGENQNKKKQIMCSRTFGQGIYEREFLQSAVASYTSFAMEKLRKQSSVCSEISVAIHTSPFKETEFYYGTKTAQLPTPTADTRKMIKAAFQLLDEIFRPGLEYKKAIVSIGKIQDESGFQPSFFEATDSPLAQRLMKTMDAINRREGPDSVKSLACGTQTSSWSMKQIHRSPRYLSGWNELPKI